MKKDIKNIDGKTYIEVNQKRRQTIRTIIEVAALIIIVSAIIGLIMAIVVVLKNRDMLTHEPLGYVMGRYQMTACQCIDSEGEIWHSGDTGFKPKYETYGFDPGGYEK